MNSSISEYNKKRARMRRYEKIMSTVNELLEKYIGGQVFFTELDKAVKFDVDILYDLIDAVHEKWGTENLILIASGEIGLAFHNFGLPVDIIVDAVPHCLHVAIEVFVLGHLRYAYNVAFSMLVNHFAVPFLYGNGSVGNEDGVA